MAKRDRNEAQFDCERCDVVCAVNCVQLKMWRGAKENVDMLEATKFTKVNFRFFGRMQTFIVDSEGVFREGGFVSSFQKEWLDSWDCAASRGASS